MKKIFFSTTLLALMLSACGNKDAEIAECVRFNSDLVYNHYLPIYEDLYSAFARSRAAASNYITRSNSNSAEYTDGKAARKASENRAKEIPTLRVECGKSIQYIWTPPN
jgi:hypothetical protein